MQLDENEEKVLSKGLLFIPTPNQNRNAQPVEDFKKRMRLQYIFRDKPTLQQHPFKLRSAFEPGPVTHMPLEEFLSGVETTLRRIDENLTHITQNITTQERRAMNKLLERKDDIIIKKADKGSTLTAATVQRYIEDGENHLRDQTAYKRVNQNNTGELAGEISDFVQQLHEAGYVDRIELKFLLPMNPTRTPFMYFPYKIHKVPIAVRPVVSGINSPTHNLLKYSDYFYKQLVPKVKSYVKISQQIVRELKTTYIPQSENIILVTMDIKLMYTNIPLEEGIKSLLTKSNVVGLPPHIIRKMLNYILKCNTFSFNGKLYQQIKGIAMGTPIAPTLANNFMSDVEEEFLETQVFTLGL